MTREKSGSFPEFEIWRNLSEGRISYPQTSLTHFRTVIGEKEILELWASGVSEDILGQALCLNFASLRRYDDSNMPLITEIKRWFWTNSPLTFYGEFSDFVLLWGDLPKFYKSHNNDGDIFGKPAKNTYVLMYNLWKLSENWASSKKLFGHEEKTAKPSVAHWKPSA